MLSTQKNWGVAPNTALNSKTAAHTPLAPDALTELQGHTSHLAAGTATILPHDQLVRRLRAP